MKVVRPGLLGSEVSIVLVGDDREVDVSVVDDDVDVAFFVSGLQKALVAELTTTSRVDAVGKRRLGPALARPHQTQGIGLNYRDHAAETGQAVPAAPVVLSKSLNCLVGQDDDVLLPPGATKTDREVELAAVVGRRSAFRKEERSAGATIAGHVLVTDVIERAGHMEHGGHWLKRKSAPTFSSADPWPVTPDEVGDLLDLEMRLDVDRRPRQRGSTSMMISSPTFIAQHLGRFMSVEPGDLIATGTPPVAGMGMRPRDLLGVELLTLTVTRLGSPIQHVVSAPVDGDGR